MIISESDRTFGVVYLLTDPQHAARLVVSIYTLRRFYQGPVTIFSTRKSSKSITERLASDPRLSVDIRFMEEATGENAAYVTKPRVVALSPYDATLFLDADTLVVGSISELIQAVRQNPLVVTGFCNWTTQDPIMEPRFASWSTVRGDGAERFQLRNRIEQSINNPFPAINAGVFGFQRNSTSLANWSELTDLGHDKMLPDEMALQLLLVTVEHQLLDTRFNCSLAFMDDPQDVRIWHFAATTHMSHAASSKVWLAAYLECRELDIAQLNRWSIFLPIENPTAELASWAMQPQHTSAVPGPSRSHDLLDCFAN